MKTRQAVHALFVITAAIASLGMIGCGSTGGGSTAAPPNLFTGGRKVDLYVKTVFSGRNPDGSFKNPSYMVSTSGDTVFTSMVWQDANVKVEQVLKAGGLIEFQQNNAENPPDSLVGRMAVSKEALKTPGRSYGSPNVPWAVKPASDTNNTQVTTFNFCYDGSRTVVVVGTDPYPANLTLTKPEQSPDLLQDPWYLYLTNVYGDTPHDAYVVFAPAVDKVLTNK